MNIGSVFLSLLADGSKLGPQVEQEAAKAGDAGAKTLGQKLAGGLKTNGLKVFGAAASAAFALAAAGASKLEDIQARLTAETGATADEAKAAAKAINKAAGDERMSLEAVSDIAIKVRRDLGATGDEANELTADFARFARVTRQDGAGAVADFDDILDAWGLTLNDSRGLMDKLIVSGQKYGGTIADDQKALAAIAPQLKAFNLGVDDGIALLDLFKASGLDASAIPKALNSAIQKLDGRPLSEFVAELAGIEDPGLRAQRAIEVFGAKAGVQLANAIKPGMTSLEDFKISTEESIGATDRAADALDSTWGARFQKLMSQAGAAIRGFGADFGPALTGAASLASLVATLGGGKLLKGLASVTLKPLAGLGIRIATFIAAELAASTVATRLAGGLASAIGAIPGAATVKAALTRAGTLMGARLALGIALGLATLGVALVIEEIQRQVDENKNKLKQIGADVGNQIATGTTEQLTQSRDAIKTAIDQIEADTKRGPIQMATPQQIEALKGLVEQYNLVQTELNKRAEASAKATQYALEGAKNGTAQAAQELVDQLPTVLEKNQARARAAAEEWIRKPIGERLALMGPAGVRAGAETSLGVAQGIRDKRSGIRGAIDQLKESIKHALSPSKEIGEGIGLLLGKAIRTGLKSADPEIRAQAEGTRSLIEARLIELVQSGGKAGQDVLDELARKMKSKDPAVKAQAERTKSVIDNALTSQTAAKTPGDAIGDQLNADLRDKGTVVGRTAYDLGRTIARNLLAGVKGTGYVAPRSTSTVPHQVAPEYGQGTWGVPGDQFAYVHDREIIVPQAESDAIRAGTAVLGTVAAATAGGEGGDTFNLFLPDARHTNPWAVLDRVPRYAKQAKAEAAETGWKAAG